MPKYTDEQIKKALECCSDEDLDVEATCSSCPLYTPDRVGFEDDMCLHRDKLALDLINRQEAEIERMKTKCENTQIGYNFAKDDIENLKKDKYKLQKALNQSEDYRVIAKSEAIKKFAERLKEDFRNSTLWGLVSFDRIDNLVKEMVGEGE